MTNHLKGLLITTLGVLLVVPDSLFVRLIDSDPMVTAFWRGAIAGSLVLVLSIALKGISGFKLVLRTGRVGILYIFLIGSTTPAFVLAVTNTSVANVVFIFASIPIFASIFSLIFLDERINKNTFVTILVVAVGLGIIAYGSSTSNISSWKGDLWAVYVSVAYAGALTAIRKIKEISMIPAIPIAYLGTAALIGIYHSPFPGITQNWHLYLGHGFFIGSATCLLTLAPRFLSSPEVSLLILLESVFAPILVWIVIGEYPGVWSLFGGAIVLIALTLSNLVLVFKRKTL